MTEAGMARELADATGDAIREATGRGGHVTPETLRGELSGPIVRLTGGRVFDDVNTGSILGQVSAKAQLPSRPRRLVRERRRNERWTRS